MGTNAIRRLNTILLFSCAIDAAEKVAKISGAEHCRDATPTVSVF